jgi:predicted DNA binding CopG/RHH family protein
MSRTITRKTKMLERITLRATPEDITNIKLAAQKKGIDCSAFVRGVLIKEGIIEAI